ncbi:MAG: M20/M25/M40 family metallo-hydrolase [Candidatus Eisenbacteria bacterium]|nr:M20/M25/M40 family metallo-hydrolase [Candidatus Eisenbacteria bacterium]
MEKGSRNPDSSLGQEVVDWSRANEEAIRILQDLIRIDTSNPPGNETKVAEYLHQLFSQEGIESEILEPGSGRGTIVARIRGSGKQRPILLLSHTDVVGVEREKWSLEPFSGQIKEDYLYGRGAIDDKGMTAVETEIMLLVRRHNIPLDRDIVFVAEADEEAGGRFGINWIVKNHFQKIDAEVAINEGGRVMESGGKVRYVAVQTTEKVPYNVKLTVEGHGGHASMPRPDNCISILSTALSRISKYETKVKLNPAARVFFNGLAKKEKFPASFYLKNLKTPMIGGFCSRRVSKNLMLNAVMRNTVSPTILRAGIRANVIPSSCEAHLNVRLLPGETIEEFVSELENVVRDNRVKIEYKKPEQGESEGSSFQNEFFAKIVEASKKIFPGAEVVPFLSAGATDSRALRKKGMQAYGILPFPLTEDDLGRMHGNDERVSLKSFYSGLLLLYTLVTSIAGARQ